jgi:AraC-like DNA-binding protein
MKRLGHEIADPLGVVVGAVRFSSTIFCRSVLTAPWGFSVAGRELASFHFVERGASVLEVAGAHHQIAAGDLVILPHGDRHAMRDARGSAVCALDDLVARHPVDDRLTLTAGGGGAETSLICGGFVFEDRANIAFLGALPRVLHVRADRARRGWLELTQLMIARELDEGRSGATAIIGRLADALFIEAVRTHFESYRGPGWAAALQDPQVANALAAIHDDPGRAWTVATLAAHVGVSRSLFARRFAASLGESPIRYLARTRVAKASDLLRRRNAKIAHVAELVGYESEAAFGRAFRRHVGVTPAEFRREATRRERAGM